MTPKKLNQLVLSILGPVLLFAGIAGFLIPERYSLISGAAPYNMFHIVCGAIGVLIISSRRYEFSSYFNLGYGMINIYQLISSLFGFWPIQYFLWTSMDDFLHLTLGTALCVAGFYGIFKSGKEPGEKRQRA